MKPLIIALLLVIAGLGIWRVMANRVDFTKPESVSKAFMAALKGKDIDKASKYWIPADAEAWRTASNAKIESWQSGSYTRFFEDLPASSVDYVEQPATLKTPAHEKTMRGGETSINVRQIENKWYVCSSPL